MLKGLAILAMVLAVSQATVSIPRHTADSAAQTSAHVKGNSQGHQRPPAAPLASGGANQTPPTNGNSGEQTRNDAPHSVEITKFPSVSVSRDWLDWGVWIFSGLLVIVGGLQAALLWGTLGAIKTQAGLMEKQRGIMEGQTSVLKDSVTAAQASADAAAAQIKMMKQKERARVAVKRPRDFMILDLSFIDFNVAEVEIENFGSTHAINVRAHAIGEITDSKTLPDFPDLNPTTVPSVLRANSDPTTMNVWLLTTWDEKKVDFEKPNLFLNIRGVIEYEDVFRDKHTTGFRYTMQINGLAPADPAIQTAKITSYSGWLRVFKGPLDNHAT